MPYFDPSFFLSRNDLGLISDGSVEYVYDDDGYINWRKMVRPKYLVPNKQLTDETDVTKIEDSKLLITLAGSRYLARVRGFSKVGYKPIIATESYFATSCKILWIPNYESNYNTISFEALADASLESTKGFAMNYLAAVAENRAFVRCVRNFLNITIPGEEEIGIAGPIEVLNSNTVMTPTNILLSLMEKKGLTFDVIKAKLIEEKFEKAEELLKIEDIPQLKVYELLKRLKHFKG